MRRFALAMIAAATVSSAPLFGQNVEKSAAADEGRNRETTAPTRELSPREQMLQKLLHTKLTVDFDGSRVGEVFDYLRTALDLNLIVRYYDDRVGDGIDPDSRITLSVEEMPAIDVIELVNEQCGTIDRVTWQIRRSFVEVGTREQLSTPSATEVRVYPIADLLHDPPRFTNAPTFRLEDEIGAGYPVYGAYMGGYHGRYFGNFPRTYGRSLSFPRGGFSGGIQFTSGGGASSSSRAARRQQSAERLIDIIVEMIEPDAWTLNGGEWASIEYLDGQPLVRAPDFIHRQIGGYPKVPPPK